MKNYFKLGFLFSTIIFFELTLFAGSGVQTLRDSKINVKGQEFRILIEAISSRPGAKGGGYCGAGREVTLKILEGKSKKIIFSLLIESCVKGIELENDGGEIDFSDDTISAQMSENPITLKWLTYGDKRGVTAKIDLSSGKAKYAEKNSQ